MIRKAKKITICLLMLFGTLSFAILKPDIVNAEEIAPISVNIAVKGNPKEKLTLLKSDKNRYDLNPKKDVITLDENGNGNIFLKYTEPENYAYTLKNNAENYKAYDVTVHVTVDPAEKDFQSSVIVSENGEKTDTIDFTKEPQENAKTNVGVDPVAFYGLAAIIAGLIILIVSAKKKKKGDQNA